VIRNLWLVVLYPPVVGLVVIAVAWVIGRGPGTTTQVTITLDVGAIIAASLGGTGIAAAGIAYALTRLGWTKKTEDHER
jgi:hypothetical protein